MRSFEHGTKKSLELTEVPGFTVDTSPERVSSLEEKLNQVDTARDLNELLHLAEQDTILIQLTGERSAEDMSRQEKMQEKQMAIKARVRAKQVELRRQGVPATPEAAIAAMRQEAKKLIEQAAEARQELIKVYEAMIENPADKVLEGSQMRLTDTTADDVREWQVTGMNDEGKFTIATEAQDKKSARVGAVTEEFVQRYYRLHLEKLRQEIPRSQEDAA